MTTAVDSRLADWDRKSKPLIVAAAVAPILVGLIFGDVVTSLHAVVDTVSWLIFMTDLWVRRSIDRHYLRSGSGIFDMAIVILTLPWYLIPGVGAAQFMSVFRLARLVRLVTATGLGMKTLRVLRRLGTLGIWLAATSGLAALIVMRAEPAEAGFETFGDALWWAMVSFTTVGYGDLFPTTALGRFAGVLMMFAGLAALGTVAAVLGSSIGTTDAESEDSTDQRILSELTALRSEVAELRDRLDE